jgi:DNA polymerase-3 subunit beta
VKLTIPRDVLAAMTSWATAAASLGMPDGITPILAGIMLTAEANGTLTIARFGYEASASVRADAEVGEPGRVLLPARLLDKVAAALPAGTSVELAFDGTRVSLDAGSAEFALLALPPGEYPALPTEPAEFAAEFDPRELAAAVGIAAMATAAPADALPALTGVRVELDGNGTVTLAATDRYRLAVATCPYTAGLAEPGAALIPARELLAALKHPGSAPVRLAITPNVASLASDGRHVTIRQLDHDKFPTIASHITEARKGTTASAVAEVAALAAAVKRAAVVAAKDTPARFRFTADNGGGVRIESGTGDEATHAATVRLRLDGDPIDIAFRPGYLLDGLAAVAATGSTQVRIAMSTPNKPALITPAEGDRHGGCTYVLMPVRAAG